jgi:hypothetical protein
VKKFTDHFGGFGEFRFAKEAPLQRAVLEGVARVADQTVGGAKGIGSGNPYNQRGRGSLETGR